MDCQRCGGAGHTDVECPTPETALMDFLSAMADPGGEEWKPTAEKQLELAALRPAAPPPSSPPAAARKAGAPGGAPGNTLAGPPACSPAQGLRDSFSFSQPERVASAPALPGVPAGTGSPAGLREWIEAPVLVALGVAVSALLVLLAVAWLFL